MPELKRFVATFANTCLGFNDLLLRLCIGAWVLTICCYFCTQVLGLKRRGVTFVHSGQGLKDLLLLFHSINLEVGFVLFGCLVKKPM